MKREEEEGVMADRIKHMVDIIADMSLKSGYSLYQVFTDWVQCTAIGIQNASCLLRSNVWESREKRYLDVYNRYSINRFPELTALLAEELEEDMSDVLGHLFMSGGMGSGVTGQFFTPFHLSYLTASLIDIEKAKAEPVIVMNEPSIGGGGMVIAMAKVLHEHGINYQKKLRVIGQDLDHSVLYMAYIQLSLLGIDAVLVQGDTLREPYRAGYPLERTYRTPRNMGVLL